MDEDLALTGAGRDGTSDPRRADFLVAATGSRGFALGLLLLPTAAGLLLGGIAYLLGFGWGTIPDLFHAPLDVLSNPTCFLLQRNLSLFSLILCPALAGAVLAFRYRGRAQQIDGGPAIDWPYGLVAAGGVLAILIAAPQYHRFGPISHAACRIAEPDGIADLLAASIIALLSPLATTAAVTGAYALLRHEYGRGRGQRVLPATLPVGTERRHMKRTGIVLIGIGLLHIGYAIGMIRAGHAISALGGILLIVLGALLAYGSLAAARFGAWCVALVAPAVVAWIALPLLLEPTGLWVAEWRMKTWSMVGAIGFDLAAIALLFGVYHRLRARPILAARAALGRVTAAPWTGLMLGIVLLAVDFYAENRPLDEFDVLRAREKAEAQYGKDLSYHIERLFAADGRVYADIVAYGGDRLFNFQIYWTPQASQD